jgi:hypothetical protein
MVRVMDARTVERAELRLHELKLESVGDLALAVVALAGAVVGTRLLPSLAAPLLVGGLGVGLLGLRALVRRYLLVEDLTLDRAAHAIPEVHRAALRTASPEHRRVLAGTIRHTLTAPELARAERVDANRDVLEELTTALEDEELTLDPVSAAALDRLLTDGQSGLYSSAVPADELRSRLRQVLASFSAVERAA